MNPFDLYGPEFLLFYLALGGCVVAWLVIQRRSGEPDPTIPVDLNDPYQIAYLRGGSNEVLRIVTLGLIDRGLLDVNGSRLKVHDEKQAQLTRDPVERAVLQYFDTEEEAASVFSSGSLRTECEGYRAPLSALGLLPGEQAAERKMRNRVIALLVLWSTAVTKLVLASQRGRHNTSFLVILTIGFTVAVFVIGNVRRTKRGELFLEHVRILLADLRLRASTLVPHSSTNELLLLGAVFGVAAVPAVVFPYARKLYPKASASDSCDSSCGSADGSDGGGGDSGSGSDGGGGGCGGCGS